MSELRLEGYLDTSGMYATLPSLVKVLEVKALPGSWPKVAFLTVAYVTTRVNGFQG